jgi:superfamily II DNA/RNA helicase
MSRTHAGRAIPGATPASSFTELGVPKPVTTALTRRGISAPRPIQALALPDALTGRDILGQAETGSGKTLAFGLPLLVRLTETGSRRIPGNPSGLVIVPTRELAVQVRDELAPLAAALGLQVLAVYGGASIRTQIQALQRGTDVVVATPGRLTDLINQGACSLSAVAVTVLDEADHMTDMGFLPAVTWLLDRVPGDGQRLLFSATLDNDVDVLIRRYLTDPAHHTVAPGVGARMHHQFRAVTAPEKLTAATELVGQHRRALLFVRTKHGADRLARQLRRVGVQAGALHGNLTQNARQRALAAFATGTVPVLVATDVAARGLHVDGVDLVMHYDPPAEPKAYLHRSGRTARAGASGTIVTLVLPDQAAQVDKLSRDAGISVPPSRRATPPERAATARRPRVRLQPRRRRVA